MQAEPCSVDIWVADLREPRWSPELLEALLSDDELARAARFRDVQDRRDFVIGRGLVRSRLADYLQTGEVELATDRWDKPHVVKPAGDEVAFNVSHSDGLLAIAFAHTDTVGVDIERVRCDLDHDGLAARFFSPAERRAYFDLPESIRPQGFFNCWTRKEALVKANGMGLSLPLESFTVSLRPDEPAALLEPGIHLGKDGSWTLHAFTPREGYCGALALPAQLGSVRIRELVAGTANPPVSPTANPRLHHRHRAHNALGPRTL